MIAKYRNWCAQQGDVPLFARDWWLDAVCGVDNWSVAGVSFDHYSLVIPLYRIRMKGLSRLVQPPWTQYSFIFDLKGACERVENIFLRNELWKKLISEIPDSQILELNLPPQFQDGLAFHWSGCQVMTRYTFHIPLDRKDALVDRYTKNLKRNLKSAQHQYQIESSADVNLLESLVTDTWKRKNLGVQLDKTVLKRMMMTLIDHNQGRFSVAKDIDGRLVGGVLVAWDKRYTYYIIGGHFPKQGRPSPHSVLMHHAIQESLDRGLIFDFCGSTIPGVARFFSSFGGEVLPFLSISKYSGVGRLKKIRNIFR